MLWPATNVLGRRPFDDFPAIHDNNLITDVFDHRKIVSNK